MSDTAKSKSSRKPSRSGATGENAPRAAVRPLLDWHSWLLGLLLVLATVLAYQQVWRAGFVWNDDISVTANPLLTAADGWKRIWLSLDAPSKYFPLVFSTFRLEHALWGLNPVGYHWVNISLHATNALLLWILLRTLRIPGAWLAAALFALHPVQVESVAWISERKNVLMGFFFLLTLVCWARFIRKQQGGRWAFYTAALLLYALALASKTTACTLPAALLLILWLKRKPINLARIAQVVPFVILGGAMGAVSIWGERFYHGAQGPAFAVAFPDRILIGSRAVWFYLEKLIWPNELSSSYPRWPLSTANPLDFVWLGAIIAAALLIWFLRRYTGRSVEVALLFFVASLAPTLGFIMLYSFRYSWVADHYQYLACIGPLALVAAGVDLLSERFGRVVNWLVALGGAAVLLSLGAVTWRQGAIYQNEETLWRATIATNPGSWMAHNNLGIRLLRDGRAEEAKEQYLTALQLNPQYAEAHFNLGNALVFLGQAAEARESYALALGLYPKFAAAHANLGALLLRLGETNEGIAHLTTAVEIDPKLSDLRATLATAYAASGDKDKATEQWRKALDANEADAAAHSGLGIHLAQNGQVDEGLVHLRRVVELEPESAEAHYNLANTYSQMERREEAITQYREALRIRSDYAAAHQNLANSYAETGRYDEAITEYNRVLELRPNSAAAHKNLATILHRMGREEEAATHLQQAGDR